MSFSSCTSGLVSSYGNSTKYQVLRERSNRFYRYGRYLNSLTIMALLVFSLLIYYSPSLQGIACVPYLFLVVFAAFVISAIVFIAGLIRMGGKWALLLIVIVVAIATLRILLGGYTHSDHNKRSLVH